jgi:hypothetical protein
MVTTTIIGYQRIKNTRFDNQGIDASSVQHKIEEYDDEQIAGWVIGIIKVAASFRDIFKPAGTLVLGSGKRYFPENTLLVTNYRLLFIQIPVSGGNKIVGDTDYVEQNFFFNRAEIRQKGEEILKTYSLSQILRLATNDILYRDIKTLTLKQNHQIIVEELAGQRISYSFWDKEYFDSLKRLFRFYLKERFVQK